MSTFLTACRFLNVGLYVLVTVAYFIRSNDLWASLPNGIRVKRVGIGAVFLVISIGSANAYRQHITPAWPIPCLTAAALLVLAGLWLSRRLTDRHS